MIWITYGNNCFAWTDCRRTNGGNLFETRLELEESEVIFFVFGYYPQSCHTLSAEVAMNISDTVTNHVMIGNKMPSCANGKARAIDLCQLRGFRRRGGWRCDSCG